jgi:hypothetical protein
VQQRAVAEVERIAAAHEEQDMVACFSHGDIIRLLAAHFLGVPLDLFQRVAANTASITVVHIDKKGRPHVAHMNQVLNFEFKQDKPDPAGGRTEIPSAGKPKASQTGCARAGKIRSSQRSRPEHPLRAGADRSIY